ncbi:MAG: substrate-binding domain-containing protein [Methylacidiphilaceae bacterium]|nr:substrate-binding domain-containing protein [Candidatus Methylacidiphilaceae bacterium]
MAASAALAWMVDGIASPNAHALKFVPIQHHRHADAAIPSWKPGQLDLQPEEELHIVGADVMDQMALGWAKRMRQAYPHLSVTMEARASGTGTPALIDGRADVATIGREMLPSEEKAFVDRFGYKPFAIRVATGSVGSLGKTAAIVILVDKDNPITGLTLSQLDAIYGKDRKRGEKEDILTWGDLGLKREWEKRPIHLYGLAAPNGIEAYFQARVLEGGAYKPDIQFTKGNGFTHAFNVAVKDMAGEPGGLTYATLANVEPNVKPVPLSEGRLGPFVLPTTETVYEHAYPLSRYIYIYVNRVPGKPLEPKVKEFLKLVLSKQGQEEVAKDGVYLPLTPNVVREELAKLR